MLDETPCPTVGKHTRLIVAVQPTASCLGPDRSVRAADFAPALLRDHRSQDMQDRGCNKPRADRAERARLPCKKRSLLRNGPQRSTRRRVCYGLPLMLAAVATRACRHEWLH